MKNNKIGQLTIFIIIAILVIGAVALFFTLSGTLQREKAYPIEVAPIANFVQECLDDVSEEVVYAVGDGGGYYYPPKLTTDVLGIPYYKIRNKTYLPTKERVEQQISRYVSENMLNCTRDFRDFPNYEIKQGKISSNTEILEDSVKINLNYPLTILKEDSSYRINDFETEIFVLFGIVYNAINMYIEDELAADPLGICVTCLLDVSEKYGIYIDSFDIEEGDVVFMFIDNSSFDEDENPFKYVFANKY